MGWLDRLELTLGIIVAVVPVVVNIYLFVKRQRLMRVTRWRFLTATTGLMMAVLAALITPVFFVALEVETESQGQWLAEAARWGMLVGVVIGLLAVVLLGFGRARVRWLGIAMTLMSLIFLYVNLLGLSD